MIHYLYTEELEHDLRRAEKVIEAVRLLIEAADLRDDCAGYCVPVENLEHLAARLIEYERGASR